MKTALLILPLCLFVLPRLAQAQAPTNGLVAHYTFSGNANDAAGSLNGTVNGAALTTDRFGVANKAYAFNGTNTSIDFSGLPMTVVDNWTMSVWAKVGSLNQFGTLINVGYDDGGSGDGYGMLIADGGFGGSGNRVTVIHGGLAFRPIPDTINSTTEWKHFTFLRRNGQSEFYVNGVKIHTVNIGTPRTPTDFSIGSSNGVRFFNGSLDEVRIYNQALSEAEVQQLYQDEALPTITLLATNPLTCTATSTTLTTTGADPNAVYAYAGPSGTVPGSSSAVVVSQAGTYTVVVTAPGGGNATASVTVVSNTTVPTLSVSPLSGTLTGINPSLTLNATSSTTALNWNTGAITSNISVNMAGTYSVTATGANGCTVSASTTVIQGGPVDQTINFAAIPDKYVDETVVLNATASSNLPVSYTLTTSPLSGVASLSGTTITFLGAVGQLTVRAYQAGNQDFKSAELLRTFRVFKRNQTITFAPIPTKTIGDAPFSLTATATSALPVIFSVVSGSAAVAGNSLSLNAPGTVVVEARQPGNNVYSAADAVQRSFFVYEKRPDLAVKNVSSNRILVGPTDAVTVSWTIANEGIAPSSVDWSERISMQSPSGENRTLIKQLTLSTSNSLAIGQSMSRSDALTIPAQLLMGDNAVFVVEVVPGASTQEMPDRQANNLSVQPDAWAIQKTLSLVLSTSEITEGVTNGITATVNRTGSLINPLTVTIGLGNAARFSFPTSVIIPAGQTGTTFTLSIPDNNTVENRMTDQLQVSATGYPTAQVALAVLDNDLPELAITNLPASTTEGQVVTFRVATNLAPVSPLTVFLQSDYPARFAVPASVTIAAGTLSVNVSVSLVQNTTPEIDQTVMITAGATNHKPTSSTIRVNDNDVPNLELVLQANSIAESAGLFATQATLRRTAASNSIAFTANLTASLPNTLILPGTISLAAGENEKTFSIGVVDNTLVDGQRRVMVNAAVFMASCGCNTPPTSSGSVSATLTVNDNDGPSLQLTAAQQTLPESLTNAGSLRITRNTPTTSSFSVTLASSDLTEATLPATATIPVGQAFVDVPITTLDDNITDGNQQVYFTATAPGFAPGSTWVMVTDLNKPDLQIPLVQLNSVTMQAGSIVNYQVSVKNTGSATAPAGTLIHGYLSADEFIDGSDILFAQNTLLEAVPAGQTRLLLNAAKAPDAAGSYKVLFWVNPNAALTELLSTNNTSRPVSITVEPSYTATAVVAPAYFLQGSTVSITGTATKQNGTPTANAAVEVYIITQGIRRTVSAVTDVAGNYTVQFTPIPTESGHYSVGASLPGLKQTTEQDSFDIFGVRINGGTIPQFSVTLNEPLTGALTIENLSDKSISNFTLAPMTLPGGASIQFATLSSLAGRTSVQLQYTVVGTQLSNGNSFNLVNIEARSAEGIIQKSYLYYYCQAANGYLVADRAAIQASVSQSSGERQVEIRLTNRGKGATGIITVSPPKANWITSVTSKTIASLAPGETAIAVLKFLALAEVPFNFPIMGNIGISGANANGFTLPFTFEKVAEASGTVSVTVTNQFTYFSDGSPKVRDAQVKIANYFTGVVYAQGSTNANGVFTAPNVPEGKYRILVEKEKHLPYSSTLEINPGRTTETTVFLDYQAITYSWKVEPTAVQDQYDIVLETKFETNVPIPVVTIEMPKLMPALSAGQEYPFFVTLTNQGLITAKQVTLQLPPSDPTYEFITDYTPADLLAKQSIQVPVVMRRRAGAAGARLATVIGTGPCVDVVREIHFYECNASTGLWQESAASFKYGARDCIGGDLAEITHVWDTGNKKPLGEVLLLCSTCFEGGQGPEGSAGPIPEYKQEKKNCKECLDDIEEAVDDCVDLPGIAADLIGYFYPLAGAVLGALVGPVKCTVGVLLGDKPLGKGLAGCLGSELPGGSKTSCLVSLIGAVSGCAPPGGPGGDGGGGRGSGGIGARIGTSTLPDAALREIATNLQAVLNGYNAQRNWMAEVFGALIDQEGWQVLFPLVSTYLNDLTAIPASVQATIIGNMAGYDIPSSALTAFFTRWNTSIEALNRNIFAPTAEYPTIINWNQVDVYVTALIAAHNQAVNKGFKTIGGMHTESIKALNEIIEGQKNDVCASVAVQFSQQLTMTREAFEGTLVISNGHPTDAMTLLRVDLTITDQDGKPANGLFDIQTKSLTNLSDVTGTGQIGGQQQGTVKFLFIPTLAAAPQTAKLYKFGGTITYQDPYANALVSLPMVDVPITVNPSPNLMLHYFMERNILGDDALTSPAIEPSVPAELAVMVENQGYGPAVNMSISSAQPEIIDNEKGLAIDFTLIGSNFQGQPRQLGVTNINFGTIPARQTRIGQWYFTSSLLGKFVSYDAKVVHSNSSGKTNLSLIQGVKLHELTKSIRLYGNLDDGINDFLVNDVFDITDTPDIIYFSQGNRTARVKVATSGSFNQAVSAPTFTNTLTVMPSDTGFNYIKLNDPGNKLYTLVSVTRNDGQVIPLDNAWLTYVTLPVARSPIYENKFHLVDRFTARTATTYTVVWKPVNLNVPEVDRIVGTPAQVAATQVQSLTVYFNKRIDPSTFTYEDLGLTLQGGANLINSLVSITQLDTASFSVDLSPVTTGNGLYTFTVQAANVKDIYGISGITSKQVSWSQFLDVPIVQAFQGIPASRVASAYSTIQLLFNLPIDVATVTPARFTIYKNGVQQPGALSITAISQDRKLFSLTGLQTILTQNGAYELRIDLPNIKSENQIAGVQPQSVTLTVDNVGPLVVLLEKSMEGGLDSQHVPFVNMSFNEGVVGLNTAAFQLSRNGQALALASTQLTFLNARNWLAGNFGTLTYPEGIYTFTVNLVNVVDSVGNTGVSTRQVSWTVNRASSATVSNLAVHPDLGFSATDGITAAQSLTVSYVLTGNAAKVTISQVDPSGEAVLWEQTTVVAGAKTTVVPITSGGNVRIRVTATGTSGGISTLDKALFLDQIPLSAQWQFAPNQNLTTQVNAIPLKFSARIQNSSGLLNVIQLRRNGVLIPSSGLSIETVNDTQYRVKDINAVSALAGNYQLTVNLQGLSKYSSGQMNAGTADVSWTVQSANRTPVANAGTSITVASPGTVRLSGVASTDPDGDTITFSWVAPDGVTLSNLTSATTSFTLTEADRGKTYSFLLITSDGSLFSTAVVVVKFDNSSRFSELSSTYCSNATSQTLTGVPSGGTFSGPGITGNVFTPSVAGAGSHTITYTNDGQSVSQTTTVYESPDLAISPTSASLTCANPTVSLTAVSLATGSSYTWRGPSSYSATTVSVSVTAGGTYSVTATTANGCTASASTVVSSDPFRPTLMLSPVSGTLTCTNPSLTLTAISSVTALQWNTGATTASITVNSGGTYSVTATDANGCSAVASTVISQSTTPPVTGLSISGTITCAVRAVTLTAAGGSGNSYVFAGPGGSSSGVVQSVGNSATVNAGGLYSVTVINTSTGCFTTTTLSAAQSNSSTLSVSLTANNKTVSCSNPTPRLTATPGAANYQFSGPGLNQNGPSNTATASTTGVFSVTATSGGCSSMASVTLTGGAGTPPNALLAGNGSLSCQTPTISLTAVGGSYYSFSGPGNTPLGIVSQTDGRERIIIGDYLLFRTPIPTIGMAIVNQPGIYSVFVTDENGCSTTATIMVTGRACPGGQ